MIIISQQICNYNVCFVFIKYLITTIFLTRIIFYVILSRLAGVAELADAPDLGSGVFDVGVQVPSPAPKIDKFRQRLVDFTFSLFTLHYSLFTIHSSLSKLVD